VTDNNEDHCPLAEENVAKCRPSNTYTSHDLLQGLPRIFTSFRLDPSMRAGNSKTIQSSSNMTTMVHLAYHLELMEMKAARQTQGGWGMLLAIGTWIIILP
jgi:hypothetical protein